MQSQLRLSGHVVRIKDHRLLKETVLWRTIPGQVLPWRPENALQRHTEGHHEIFRYRPNCLQYLAQDTEKWREVIKRVAKAYETRRNTATQLSRKFRKETSTLATAATITCSHFPRLYRTQIGLICHLRTHGCLSQS